jgi:CBS domain-containing protein
VTSRGKAAKADVAYIGAGETLRRAGHLMRELGVGALDVRGENGEIQGTISRDMVVKRIAAGGDPKMVTVGEVARAAPRRRRAAARSATTAGRGAGTGDQGPDPGDDQGNWTEGEPDCAWPWPALTMRDTAGRDEITSPSPGLVA